MTLGTKVRVAGKGNTIFKVVEVDSPVREGEWIVRKSDGSMWSVRPETLKVVA